jgi:putative ABC transport system permease protein
MALGARVGDVLRLVFRQGLVLTLIGVAIGMALAFALTRLMRSLLFDVTPTDAMTFVMVGTALVPVALLACLVPARHLDTNRKITTLKTV